MTALRPVPALCLMSLLACTSGEQPPPVFGGEGAQVGMDSKPLPENAANLLNSGPCAQPSPPGELRLIDDFEDGDNKPFKALDREAWWYSAGDSTGGEIYPPEQEFHSDPLPPGEATNKNKMAAHFTAKGYSDWGVVWGTTLRWAKEGVRCPYNGSKFSGIRFWAKGGGRVRVKIGMPETVAEKEGGACKERCWDAHSFTVHLAPEWRLYEFTWSQLQQEGWGVQATFDPKRMLALNFSVDKKDMPIDWWLDDVGFFAAGEQQPERLLPARSAVAAPVGSATAQPAPSGSATAPTPPTTQPPVQE